MIKIGIQEREKAGVIHSEAELEKNFEKPWGFYITLARNQPCTPKILGVENELSLQSHNNRDEIWYLDRGKVAVYRTSIEGKSVEEIIAGLEETVLEPGDDVLIPRKTAHTAVNLDSSCSQIVEVSLGYAKEDDIVRYYDVHGRVKLEGYPENTGIRDMIKLCREKLGY